MTLQVFIGWDPAERRACEVARFSLIRRTSVPVRVRPVALEDVKARGLYTRPTERRDGRLWCPISEAPMSTEHANSRFLVPWLADGGRAHAEGWALFMDGDMLALRDIEEMLALADPAYAVMCVKHDHRPAETLKKHGDAQVHYTRKNWSSLVLWNLGHSANLGLTLDMVNGLPGRDLHRFCWLADHEIGALPSRWNWLEGTSPPDETPSIVHFTRGGPWLHGFGDVAHATAWRRERAILDAAELDRSLAA